MIRDQNFPDVGLDDMPLYINIRKSGIAKVAMCQELFPCAEVIGWILPHADPTTMIISNTKKKAFASFTLTYITKASKLTTPQVMMTDDWVKSVNLDIFECAKRIIVTCRQLCQKATGEYETAILCPPYRVIASMLNMIFGWENVKMYKLNWIPLIYHVAMGGTIFN